MDFNTSGLMHGARQHFNLTHEENDAELAMVVVSADGSLAIETNTAYSEEAHHEIELYESKTAATDDAEPQIGTA